MDLAGRVNLGCFGMRASPHEILWANFRHAPKTVLYTQIILFQAVRSGFIQRVGLLVPLVTTPPQVQECQLPTLQGGFRDVFGTEKVNTKKQKQPSTSNHFIKTFSVSTLLHFERNYFTGVNRLTPQTELLHTSKNEVKVIPSLPAQSWK